MIDSRKVDLKNIIKQLPFWPNVSLFKSCPVYFFNRAVGSIYGHNLEIGVQGEITILQ